MDTKKLDDTSSRDVISRLPDELLGKILSLLATKKAASTSVLAKRWRKVYWLVDNLIFVDSACVEDRLSRYVIPESKRYTFRESFENFVDRTLALRGDNPIKKFSLKCHVGEKNDSQKACVSRWISSVVERGTVSVLDLRILDRGVHSAPCQLFSSKTVVKLTLGTQLNLEKLPSKVSLPSLKTLFIDTVFVDSEDFCGVLLAGCPALEHLSVHHNYFEFRPLAISSPTVKRLSIKYVYEDGDELSLNLPNLVYLEYSDFALSEYPQVNLESLVEAKLDLYPLGVDRPDVRNLFFGIRNVEILHLSTDSVNVISRCVRHGLLLPVFNNLVKLSFGSNKNTQGWKKEKKKTGGWKLLPYLLKQSPKLETLIIQDVSSYLANAGTPLNEVKVLHILGYQGTAEELKQLKSFLAKIQCLEMVQVEIAQGVVLDLQTKNDIMKLLGVSVSSNCQIKVT